MSYANTNKKFNQEIFHSHLICLKSRLTYMVEQKLIYEFSIKTTIYYLIND